MASKIYQILFGTSLSEVIQPEDDHQAVSNSSIVKESNVQDINENEVDLIQDKHQSTEKDRMSMTMQSKQLRHHLFDDTLQQSQSRLSELSGYDSKNPSG